MAKHRPATTTDVASYCYQCVAGPDLMKIRVEDGIVTEIRPNFEAAKVHPAGGKVCVKAYGLIQKTYNPHRILTPMKRTNPKKGRHEDPGFVPISWDEALDTVAAEMRAARDKGLTDNSGYPRPAASFGGGGTPTAYMGTLPAFLGAWGPVDMSFGSGQCVKCYHSEHLYGELWHRAFTGARAGARRSFGITALDGRVGRDRAVATNPRQNSYAVILARPVRTGWSGGVRGGLVVQIYARDRRIFESGLRHRTNALARGWPGRGRYQTRVAPR